MDFLTSLALICIVSLLLGSLCVKIKLPPLIGMLVVGIVMGAYAADLIAPSLLIISGDLRQLALIIILFRAGLNLNIGDLRKSGISAILLCFIPATFEIMAYVFLGTTILDMEATDAVLLGCVMAAVSPAVILPRMLKLKESSYGAGKGIPDMIMAGASADDVFVFFSLPFRMHLMIICRYRDFCRLYRLEVLYWQNIRNVQRGFRVSSQNYGFLQK